MSEQHVVFVGIDGLQLEQFLLLGLQGEAEALNSLDIVESYTGGAEGTSTEQPTVSGPGWSTLLTGVWAEQHGVTSNNGQAIDAEVDSIFEIIDGALPDATIASIVHWDDINTGHFSADVDAGIIDYAMSGLSDQAVTDEAVDLIDTVAPDFMFLQLDDVDGAGHSSGFGEAYNQSIITVSAQLAEILAAVEAREAANPDEDWLVIVSTDHGRDPATGSGHGEQTDMERRTFIAANEELATFSDAVPATSVLTTILDFLNISFTLNADGLQSGSLLEGAADPLPPTIDAILTPVDGAARVTLDTDLSIRFSEEVQIGTGTITVHRAEDDSVVATVDVTSGAVTVSGDTVTIGLPVTLAALTDYYVKIDEGAFTDGTNAFFGISDETTWNFTTEADLAAPQVVALTPADDAEAVPTGADLTIRFDEDVVAGEGDIVVRRASDDSVFETVAITDPRVTIDGDTVTVDLAGTLEAGAEYYVQVDPGALRDTSNLITLFTEDFESVGLGPFVSPTEGGGDGTDFSSTPPAGWTQDNTTTPAGGPVEFFGWTVMDKNSWITTAGDQSRSSFTNASGAVLVADPDEYDDGSADVGSNLFNAYISMPTISLAGVEAGTATITFDSSWRAEGTQKGNIEVSYDGGVTWTEVLAFDSDSSSADYKPSATNETVRAQLDNPDGASEVIIRFGMIEAGNNWWWAIDDIVVQGEGTAAGTTGNAFAGITDKTSWTFTAAATESKLLEGTSGADSLTGGDGDDTIAGLGGADSLAGGLGDDTMSGGERNDRLDGGAGNDTLDGGIGADVLDGGADDDVLRGGNWHDQLQGGLGNDLLMGEKDNDSLKGGEGQDTLHGGHGFDLLDGDEGDDLLFGEDAPDALRGGAGNDTLDGGGSEDTLAGGEGDDVLIGGKSADIFVFGPGGGNDIVVDFRKIDSIRLDGGLSLESSRIEHVGGDSWVDTVLVFDDGSTVTLLDFRTTTPEQFLVA
ncbi:hypothetical protein GXW74_13805 [Roseomonas eburnea]|uniref:SbsA Ig-like domain-containing protein n=1 Tax=Neoroseomonas eburnea TaxID=1346889 RepID=A0A9X9XCY0_9PROT|nr:Ig-like domain-containing protein [Neoroseomonas eburnea]MBR0681566.1 hypothetical protein [Neoroseomonas eburnea]